MIIFPYSFKYSLCNSYHLDIFDIIIIVGIRGEIKGTWGTPARRGYDVCEEGG